MWKTGIAGAIMAGALAVALFAGRLDADDAEQAYRSLFGKQVKKVAASADRKDDAALARKMLDAVKEITDSPELQVLLCQRAYEFGIRDKSGYAAAVDAMKRMVELAPGRRDEAGEKLLEVYTLQFRKSTREHKRQAAEDLLGQLMAVARRKRKAGETGQALAMYRRASTVASYVMSPRKKEILDEIKKTLAKQKIEREIVRLEKTLKKNPDHQPTAKKLLMLYLVARDEPHKAVSLLRAAEADEHFKTYVPLAAAEPNQLAQDVCMELGAWYEGLTGGAAGPAKSKMLLRAKAYYARFLKVHTKKDAIALKARLALDRIEKQLEELGGKPRVRNVAGAVWATADDVCELRINGKPVLQSDIRSRKLAKVALNPGDLITARLVDTGGACGFCFAFQGNSADVGFSSDTRSWFIYAPASAKSWWKARPSKKAKRAGRGNNRGIRNDAVRMAPRPMQSPCEMIWGEGRQCYLYHVVTTEELRGSGLKWISGDASYTVSSTFRRQRPLPALLAGKGDLHYGEYAFHTERQANPYIIITLKQASPIKRIVIVNRGSGVDQRARGLTVWVSTDRKRWNRIWTARSVESCWRIDLKTPVSAKYVKIGLRHTDFFHLASVRIYR